MSKREYEPKLKTPIIISGVVAIALMILVFLLVAFPMPEHRICRSYPNETAGRFGVMVNDRQVGYVDTQREADELMASYKECQKK